jgi:hypothetical protein
VTTEGTERLRVTDTGLVGIGTNSPGSYNAYADDLVIANGSGNPGITLAGSATGWGSIYFADGTTGSEPYSGYIQYNHTNDRMTFATGGGLAAMHIDSSQRVGIGTASPSRLLHLSSAADAYIQVDRGSITSLFGTDNVGTYIGQQGAYDLRLVTNAIERARIDSSGRLGIGTSSPRVNVHIFGTASNAPTLGVASGSLIVGPGDRDYGLAMGTAAAGYSWIQSQNFISPGAAYSLLLQPSGGNVGIGTTAPTTPLSVRAVSNIPTYGNVSANFSDNTTGTLYISHSSAVQGLISDGTLAFGSGASGTERARIDTSGRLLVGTSTASGYSSSRVIITGAGTDPTGASNLVLQIGQANGSVTVDEQIGVIAFGDTSGYSYANIVAAADLAAGSDSPGRLVFSTTADGASSPTERMRIVNDGKIFIGAQTAGDFAQADAARVNIKSPSSMWTLKLYREGTGVATVVSIENGNGQVGTITTNGSSTAFNTSSDYRLKENVSAVTDGITRLQQLKPSRFNFITDPDKTVDGFIAHEVQEVVPEAITGEKDAEDANGNPKYQGIDQSKLVPLLTAALQEAIAKIETLEGMVAVNNITIDEQQHQLSTLAARLTALESA